MVLAIQLQDFFLCLCFQSSELSCNTLLSERFYELPCNECLAFYHSTLGNEEFINRCVPHTTRLDFLDSYLVLQGFVYPKKKLHSWQLYSLSN